MNIIESLFSLPSIQSDTQPVNHLRVVLTKQPSVSVRFPVVTFTRSAET